MWVSKYVIWFVVYSVLGWIYESTYCTIVERRWENRGFLYGPLCPIYGVGVIAMMAVWQIVLAEGMDPAAWQVFVVTALGSAVLEYVTSWAMEKLFNARWWDYSDMPLNINGRICLPATILFGLMGLLVCYVLYGPTLDVTDMVAPELLEALSLVLVGLVAVDTTLTVSALTQFAQLAEQVAARVNNHMDGLVNGAMERGSEAAGAFTQERERVAAQLRASRIGEMDQVVSAAVRRIRRFTPTAEVSSPVRQLEGLWADLRSGGKKEQE